MAVRTFGVEEELMLVDPADGRVVASTPAAIADDGTDSLVAELFQHQLETATRPTADASDLHTDIVQRRREAADSAARAGAALVAVGCPVAHGGEVQVTRQPRYERIVDEYGQLGRDGHVCGVHVHVQVHGDDEGVRIIDALAPWLPVLRAMSVNSPYFHGVDTGYASWRTQIWSRWPSAGPTDPFGDPAGYRAAAAALIASGAAIDEGMLYFDARLARRFPTVELRVFDAMTEVDDVVLVAMVSRALVTTVAAEEGPGGAGRWRRELLRAGHWRASRDGLAGKLLDPVSGEPVTARVAVETLLAFVDRALREAGDRDAVRAGFEGLVARGTGAARQRAAFERTGNLEGVVTDLRDRFAATLG